MHFEKLDHGIVAIDTAQHRARFAACYLVASAGRHALVETGTSHSVPLILGALDALGVDRASVDFVMPTHVHLDHAGGAGALMRELPNARLVMHPRGARHMIDPAKLIASATGVYGADAMQAMYGKIVPVPAERVMVAAVDADKVFSLALGNRALELIDVPGHASHHYAIFDAQSRGWFTGDSFGIAYPELDHADGAYLIPTTTPVQFDPGAWEASLARMLERNPERVFLTHYGERKHVAELAASLRRGLAAYCDIARRFAADPERHTRIRDAILDFHLDDLAHMHHPLAPAAARALLGMDAEINAQGLEVWLDRMARKKPDT